MADLVAPVPPGCAAKFRAVHESRCVQRIARVVKTPASGVQVIDVSITAAADVVFNQRAAHPPQQRDPT